MTIIKNTWKNWWLGCMQKRIELDGNVCRIAKNGDLAFVPAALAQIYPLLSMAALVGIWFWARELRAIAATLWLASNGFNLIRQANQPKVRITPGSGMIEWHRWFRRRRLQFGDIVGVKFFLDRRMYAWSTHLVDRRKNEVELHARLVLIMKDNRTLVLGCISGEYAQERTGGLAQSIAKVIGVPVSQDRDPAGY